MCLSILCCILKRDYTLYSVALILLSNSAHISISYSIAITCFASGSNFIVKFPVP